MCVVYCALVIEKMIYRALSHIHVVYIQCHSGLYLFDVLKSSQGDLEGLMVDVFLNCVTKNLLDEGEVDVQLVREGEREGGREREREGGREREREGGRREGGREGRREGEREGG